MSEIENNDLLIDDFGKMKMPKGAGLWNRGSRMELTNGSRVTAVPITGASLGTRPSGVIVLDDVEKGDDLVQTPSDLRENFERFFFNAIYPMSQSPGFQIPIRVVGTLYHRRMFIWWLYSTKDPRISGIWKQTLMTIRDMDWEVMDEEWQERTRRQIGVSAFNAQYMNDPGTEAERILVIHPELCTYWLDNPDDAAYNDPLNSDATVVTHVCSAIRKTEDGQEMPVPRRIRRPWSEVVAGMRRFITVDSARTTTELSDFSAVHVMGFENTPEHRDTLYSLDLWVGKKRPEEIIRILYQMAVKWHVTIIGVEAYPVLAEFYERVRDNLPAMYGANQAIPQVIPIKFPQKMEKADKIMQMEWRFRHYRVKLPVDRRSQSGYTRLFYETENFTEDMALLDHDDAIDTLAMHQRIGKQHMSAGPDIVESLNLVQRIKDGDTEAYGVPLMSGVDTQRLSNEDIRAILDMRYEQAAEEYGEDPDHELMNWMMPQLP
jgi:hypothetical protein